MIVVRLMGGLGNQMFQYAFGRELSVRFTTPLLLDISNMTRRTDEHYTERKFELSIFNLNKNNSLQSFPGIKLKTNTSLIHKVYDKLNNLIFKPVILRETVYGQITALPENGRRNIYISGYWQSEDYFKRIRNQIRRDFMFPSLPEKFSLIRNKIGNTNSVSIHVRRGDYLKPANMIVLGILPNSYYSKAIRVIENKIGNPVFFVYSDDMSWAKSNIISDHEIYFIEGNVKDSSYIDMQLMSECKHNIIANSSFSWWGAWLNRNPGKYVIAPERWFADTEMNNQCKKLIPENWIRL